MAQTIWFRQSQSGLVVHNIKMFTMICTATCLLLFFPFETIIMSLSEYTWYNNTFLSNPTAKLQWKPQWLKWKIFSLWWKSNMLYLPRLYREWNLFPDQIIDNCRLHFEVPNLLILIISSWFLSSENRWDAGNKIFLYIGMVINVVWRIWLWFKCYSMITEILLQLYSVMSELNKAKMSK